MYASSDGTKRNLVDVSATVEVEEDAGDDDAGELTIPSVGG